MTAQLPLDSWLLILVSVGLGMAIELVFLKAQWSRRRPPGEGRSGLGGGRERS